MGKPIQVSDEEIAILEEMIVDMHRLCGRLVSLKAKGKSFVDLLEKLGHGNILESSPAWQLASFTTGLPEYIRIIQQTHYRMSEIRNRLEKGELHVTVPNVRSVVSIGKRPPSAKRKEG
jgi:hypothetical protein